MTTAAAVIAQSYTIAGRRVRVEASDPRLLRLATDFVGHYYFEPAEESDAADGSLQLDWLSAPEPLTPVVETFRLQHGVCTTDGTRYQFTVGDSQITVEPHGLVHIAIGRSERAQSPAMLTDVMAFAMEAMLRRIGCYTCHAAALVPPGGDGAVLFVGDSGHGKSTLSVSLVAAGWRYLSDDCVVLRREGERVVAFALRRLFAVIPESLDRLGVRTDAMGRAVLSDPRKHQLDPSRLSAGSFVAAAQPTTLVFPSIGGSASSTLAPLAAHEALTLLLRHSPWSAYDRHCSRDYLALLGDVARQSRAFTLDAGLDLIDRPAAAHELLRSVISR